MLINKCWKWRYMNLKIQWHCAWVCLTYPWRILWRILDVSLTYPWRIFDVSFDVGLTYPSHDSVEANTTLGRAYRGRLVICNPDICLGKTLLGKARVARPRFRCRAFAEPRIITNCWIHHCADWKLRVTHFTAPRGSVSNYDVAGMPIHEL